MEIELKHISIAELTQGYTNNLEEGVVGYDGKLDIRPKYQREFVYNDKQKIAVIKSVMRNYPLNIMYWVDNGNDKYEVLDGQQRSLSICEYINGGFSVDFRYFHNLEEDEKEQILNYRLLIYFCKGRDREKLDWFKTINIAGEKLTDQELRNAVYSGTWISDAKKYFSKSNCPAFNVGSDYLKGSPIRQDYLETVIKWISKDNIDDYMAIHQKEPNANELWLYFQSVINWVKAVFPNYRKEMKGIHWGTFYNDYKEARLDPTEIESVVSTLMIDEDVTNKKGIYPYVFTKNEKYLNIRSFTNKQKRESYERQKGICPVCTKEYTFSEMEADHITPWHKGGQTKADNCQMLCKKDNRVKSGK